MSTNPENAALSKNPTEILATEATAPVAAPSRLDPDDDAFDDDDDLELDEEDVELMNDWRGAKDSIDIADVLLGMLDDKVYQITGGGGQEKVIWMHVIAELYAAYYRRFCEYAEVSNA